MLTNLLSILILFFSLAYMAITLDITGVLQSAAFWVSNKGGNHGWRLYFYFYVMVSAGIFDDSNFSLQLFPYSWETILLFSAEPHSWYIIPKSPNWNPSHGSCPNLPQPIPPAWFYLSETQQTLLFAKDLRLTVRHLQRIPSSLLLGALWSAILLLLFNSEHKSISLQG